MQALVLGAGGFIGSHMVGRLKSEGYYVVGADLKYPEFSDSSADEFYITDLRVLNSFTDLFSKFSESKQIEVYQFAADMGGAGFVFTGDNDAAIMHNSVQINLNLLKSIEKIKQVNNQFKPKILFASSACIYPAYNQQDPTNPKCGESTAYPADPDSEYGWEKLFSERLYFAYHRNHGIPVRVARYHNIFGPDGTWEGGREKAPAAICRKVALARSIDEIEVWGDGKQTRSFLYIDDCIEATRKFMDHPSFIGPVNIGSEEMVTINQLVEITAKIAGKTINKKYISGPLGVRGRNSDNDLIREIIGWDYKLSLESGIEKTYNWISKRIELRDHNGPTAKQLGFGPTNQVI